MVSTLRQVQAAEDSTLEETSKLSFKEKVWRLQNSIRGIAKDKENPHFKYAYVSAQNVNEVVKDQLEALRLIANASTELVELQDKLVIAETTITLIDVDSDAEMEFRSIGSGTDSGDKMAMKAATASQKYGTLAMIFGSSKDDPEADARTDMRGTPVATAAPSVRTNRPVAAPPIAGNQAAAQGPVATDANKFVVTVEVDKVYDGRPTKSGKVGPGTVVDTSGTKYDTFDKGLLGIARGAHEEGKRVNIMYFFNEQYQKNSIVEHGLSVFGEVEPVEGSSEDSPF